MPSGDFSAAASCVAAAAEVNPQETPTTTTVPNGAAMFIACGCRPVRTWLRQGWLVVLHAGEEPHAQAYHARDTLRAGLQDVIDVTPCCKETFLVNEFGRAFTANGFGNWFRKRCDEAELYHCSAHGLRKAAATRLAELGASEHEIMAITGHQTSKEVGRYTKASRQAGVRPRSVAKNCPTFCQSEWWRDYFGGQAFEIQA